MEKSCAPNAKKYNAIIMSENGRNITIESMRGFLKKSGLSTMGSCKRRISNPPAKKLDIRFNDKIKRE
jgi:hypothetical protein